MEYKVFHVTCPADLRDIFIAELANIGFDTMQETEQGIDAFSEDDRVDPSDISYLLERYNVPGVSGKWKEVENTNWNEEWEKNYDPVAIGNSCYIRADFHESRAAEFGLELVINPRMSFGTGHHATTYLMVEAGMQLDMKGKTVLDAGCGTGVLAILAEKRGAATVVAYDVSQLCVDNTKDNLAVNGCSICEIQTGTINEIDHKAPYDIIFANINRNVLLEEMASYQPLLHSNGVLLLSGFFEEDAALIIDTAKRVGLVATKQSGRNDWACVQLKIS